MVEGLMMTIHFYMVQSSRHEKEFIHVSVERENFYNLSCVSSDPTQSPFRNFFMLLWIVKQSCKLVTISVFDAHAQCGWLISEARLW